eukprot:CAMPEP_0183351910 /NCGR_PEP_ID=MMETSP0164_2-20130417/26331_1 /TAXON_ID=221442 /ORGANISM="Coccolithus pelagicus ssp braarudi, Strain PLY182g" /LENGTH=277 /DNA_ID=CAMNT_0025524211 /DNA_START=42 /DNA_END=875 /DNA_ORIENTATION=-
MIMLMQKLETLQSETGDGPTGARGASKGGDEFKRLKANVAQNIREIRLQLRERDEIMQKGATGTKHTVQMSHAIRQQIKHVRDDANRLHDIQRKEAARNKGKSYIVQVEERQEVVDLVFKHIEEVEALDKRRYAAKHTEARIELFSGGRSGTLVSSVAPVSRVPYGGTELPDIETQEGLQQLQQKDQRIDEELEQVAAGVADLKTVALDIRDEVKVQSAMVDEITHKVDKASKHLSSINKKMKKTLQQTRSADRFILDFILLVVLLGIIGYIISLVT